jgi:hypothetical protein
MLIGAQKCGTTSLAAQLSHHPEICFCQEKEPAYFNRAKDWRATLEQYHSLYQPSEGQLCGEASTSYTFIPEWPGVPERLYEYNPELKLIYIMRQPVERVISNYAHKIARGLVSAPPETVVWKDPSLLNRSRYGVQIRPFIELFGRDKVLLMVFEEYIAAQRESLDQVANFLGIESQSWGDVAIESRHSSTGAWHLAPSIRRFVDMRQIRALISLVPAHWRNRLRPLVAKRLVDKPEFSSYLRETLWRFLEDDVATVEALLGRRLNIWREGYSK